MKTRTAALVAAAASVAMALIMVPSALAWTVTMTANPSLKRTWDWQIQKSATPTSVTLEPGQTANVDYSVTVTPTGYTDSDWAVSGAVDMSTGGFETVVINDLVVYVEPPDGFLAGITCAPSPFAVLLSPSLHCDYSTALPDASPRTSQMRAEATVNGEDGHRVVNTPFDFTNATINEVDECVDVTDTLQGALGTICAAGGAQTFTYSRTVGPYGECGEVDVPNTASFVSNDTGATGSADANVHVTVQNCRELSGGLTPGYWKQHLAPLSSTCDSTAGCSKNGPWTSQYLPQYLGNYKVDTIAKARTIYAAMNCSSSTSQDAIGCLAGHLLSSKLNVANGANTCVNATIADAGGFLRAQTVQGVTGINYTGPAGTYSLTSAQRALATSLKTTLDEYNNGLCPA